MISQNCAKHVKSTVKLAVTLATMHMLIGCSSTDEPRDGIVDSNTMLIIEKVNEIAPQAIKGEFVLVIKNTASCGPQGNVCLNTDYDYRDQRTVTVMIPRGFVRALTQMHGEHPEKYFLAKRIEIRGSAKREKIVFMNQDGTPSDKYYYQTHIIPERPETIRVIPTV